MKKLSKAQKQVADLMVEFADYGAYIHDSGSNHYTPVLTTKSYMRKFYDGSGEYKTCSIASIYNKTFQGLNRLGFLVEFEPKKYCLKDSYLNSKA